MTSIWITILVFWPMAGALAGYLIGRRSKDGRNYFADFVTVSEFALMLYAAIALRGASAWTPEICGFGLRLGLDGFRAVYGLVAALMWMMTTIFSREYFAHYRNRNRYYLFMLVTLGATMGVFLSTDLYTTFIFFEIMSFTSYVWVAQDERKESLRAAGTYLAVAVIGGLVLLMGLFLLQDALGTLDMAELLPLAAAYPDRSRIFAAGICLLIGFGAKAGAFPLHIWLPKAHPVAPAPASALLSGILTKAGVFGVIVTSANLFYEDKTWSALILCIAAVTMFLGALLAVFANDLKRTLACSSMSQIGFILTGIGMTGMLGEHGALAANGTVLHMMNHSLIKLVLFMAAGVVYMNLHKLDLNDIRGFGRKKPLLNAAFLMGTLGIGGIPLWNGYISKTLLHEAIVEYAGGPVFTALEWVFLVSGGLTVAYMTKLYICLFVEKNRDPEVQAKFDSLAGTYMNKQSAFAIGGSAILLPVLGMTATKTMMPLAQMAQGFLQQHHEAHVPHFFSWVCLSGGLISIGIGAAVYLLFIRTVLIRKDGKGATAYLDLWPEKLDLEELIYRPLVLKILPAIGTAISRAAEKIADGALLKVLPFLGLFIARLGDSLVDWVIVLLRKTIYRDKKITYHTGKMLYPTDILGKALDSLAARYGTGEGGYEKRFRLRRMTTEEARDRIGARLSYGLGMAGLGLVFVLLYILVTELR